MKATGAEIGDSVFFACGKAKEVEKISSLAREKIAQELNLIDKNSFAFCWIVDYPMFEMDDDNKIKFSHNPFSMPQGDLEKIDFNKPYIVVLQHPVTTEYGKERKYITETAKVLVNLDMQVVWLWPNVDAGSNYLSKTLRVIREIKKPRNIIWQKNYNPEDYIKLIYNSLIK